MAAPQTRARDQSALLPHRGQERLPTTQRSSSDCLHAWSYLLARDYQTLQNFAFTIGWPALHLKAVANSGRFVTMPLIRAKPGECGSVAAWRRLLASRVFSQA